MLLTKMYIWVLMFICMVMATEKLQKTPIIRVKSGRLRGVITPDGMRGYYHSYLGIPYAYVNRRFQAPTPARKWKGIFEANNDTLRCAQKDFPPLFLIQENTNVMNSEDCLNLNVFTPLPKNNSTLKPVMVFFFGGGFWYGSASPRIYGPEHLLRNDVIVITVNYRLDVLGFLCLGIIEAPGNAGMKDQVAALRWIKQNIKAFGGDPDNVTIFGESAGASAVMYHVTSPASKRLFNKAIIQSSGQAPWAFQFEPVKIASQLAKEMGYDTHDPIKMYHIFANMSTSDLISYQVPRKVGDIVLSETVFTPCIEKEIPGVEAFLTAAPHELIASHNYSKVPIIIGHNDNEGLLFAANETPESLENITFYDALPRDLLFPTEKEARIVAWEASKRYTGGRPISKDTIMELAEFQGDIGVKYSVIALADAIVNTNDKNTYIYKYEYSGNLNLMKYVAGMGEVKGATHTDELPYLFKHSLSGVNELVESAMINKMTALWTNFAKYGKPVPKETVLLPVQWLPSKKENPTVFNIGTSFYTTPLWESDNLVFWNQTYTKYRRNK